MSLTVAELRAALSALALDTRGNKQTLKTRLAKHHRSTSPSPAGPAPAVPVLRERPHDQSYDSFLVFDVEATCQVMPNHLAKLAFSYPNEIIEWPVILLQWRRDDSDRWSLEKVDEFHSFVKPTWRRELSAFCTELTGIQQADVDAAPTFPRLLRMFEREFINKHELFTPNNETVWVTDGPWDLRDFVAKACYISNTPRPDWLAGEMIDLKLTVSTFFNSIKREQRESRSLSSSPSPTPSRNSTSSNEVDLEGSRATFRGLTAPPDLSIPSVLDALELDPFQGRIHSGLSDARNLARIVIDLATTRNVKLSSNRIVPDGGKGGRERRWGWMTRQGHGEVKWEQMQLYEQGKLRGTETLSRK
ncbi:3'-5' exonuclease [Sporobolomyces koalae]|uniref:3'-5' exonuclease n=1 Tax=Sporobolomyces koalae TaxID=500713 RepID=UPI00316EB818